MPTLRCFTPTERRQMGQRVTSGPARAVIGGRTDADLDVQRAESVLPRVAQLLGIALGEPT
jgi:hypothetical protein